MARTEVTAYPVEAFTSPRDLAAGKITVPPVGYRFSNCASGFGIGRSEYEVVGAPYRAPWYDGDGRQAWHIVVPCRLVRSTVREMTAAEAR